MNVSYIINELFKGFGTSLLIFAITLVVAIPFGLIIAFGSMSSFKPVKYTVKTFVWIIRGTPLMLQIMILFFLPGLVLNIPMRPINIGFLKIDPRLISVLIAFIINYAAYFSEIYRGGIESISKGQYEAGQVLGMTKGQVFSKVILIQVFKRILPSMSNEIITLVKDTSLARVVAVAELMFVAQEIVTVSGIIWPLFATGLFYLVFVGILTILLGMLEKKFAHFN